MINREAARQADKCRFCWMCRHLCPVQLVTGKEINTPRAKGLLISMNERGAEFDADMAEAMYECLLCDACTDNCATGYNPPLFIREARTEAAVLGLLPEGVEAVLNNIEKSGNIYGAEKPSYAADKGKEVLVYVGEAAAVRAPEMVRAYLSLLDKAGVAYTVLENEPASGVMLGDLIGYTEEVREQAAACAAALNGAGAGKIVAIDSYAAQLMAEKYPEWGLELAAPVVTATSFIASLLADGKLQPEKTEAGPAAFHDDDRLARFFKEYDAGRAIAKACGYEKVEMYNHLALAKSAGTSVAKAFMPEIVKKVSAGRWDDLMRTEAKTMLVASPEAYDCLRETIPEGYELVDLFEALDRLVK